MTVPAVLAIVYELRDPAALDVARRHGRAWGRLYTDVHALNADTIALVFRSAPDERWRAWEKVRLEWILDPHYVEREENAA